MNTQKVITLENDENVLFEIEDKNFIYAGRKVISFETQNIANFFFRTRL